MDAIGIYVKNALNKLIRFGLKWGRMMIHRTKIYEVLMQTPKFDLIYFIVFHSILYKLNYFCLIKISFIFLDQK